MPAVSVTWSTPGALTSMRAVRRRLGLTQGQLATVVRKTQPTVCRWEKGDLDPDRADLQRIRTYAASQNIEWDDRWFFDPPPASEAA